MKPIDTKKLGKTITEQVKTSEEKLKTLFLAQNFDIGDADLQGSNFTDVIVDTVGKDDIFNKLFKDAFSKIIKKYKDFGTQLDGNRSTFLPIELVKGIKKDLSGGANALAKQSPEEIIANRQAYTESYENTFMRMLGLPDSDKVDDFLYYDLKRGGYFYASTNGNPQDILFDMLEERQTYFRQVSTKKDVLNIYGLKNIDDKLKDLFSKDSDFMVILDSLIANKDSLISSNPETDENYEADRKSSFVNSVTSVATEEDTLKLESISLDDKNPLNSTINQMYEFYILEKKNFKPNILNISNDFEKFTYLLLPPVQDARVSTCISEFDKIIRKPFGNFNFAKVNNEKTKVSLLESIIRIRLDKLAGYSEELNFSSSVNPFTKYKFEDVKDSYSFLENLMINRLYSTLNFLSEKLVEDIEDYITSSDITGKVVTTNDSNSGGQDTNDSSSSEPNKKDNPGHQSKTKSGDQGTNTVTENYKNINNVYSIIKSIDDTIKILLSSSDVVDIQADTFRSSGLSKGEFMGVINSLVTTPGSLAKAKVKEQEEESEKNASGENSLQGKASEITISIGLNRGIGLIDLVTFTLGMFTLPEEYLVGMLDEEQFKNLKDAYPTFNFFEGFEKPTITDSVIEYTKNIIGIYSFVKEVMNSDDI